ncbi:MAG: ubiquitin-like small modifier protein 1 [Candidatus Hadarchaeia archaeon]
MSVTVRFFANFRDEVGKSEIKLSASSVKELLRIVSEKEEGIGKKMFKEDELTLRDSISIMVNGRKINLLDGVDTELDDGDVVAIFPPVAGG